MQNGKCMSVWRSLESPVQAPPSENRFQMGSDSPGFWIFARALLSRDKKLGYLLACHRFLPFSILSCTVCIQNTSEHLLKMIAHCTSFDGMRIPKREHLERPERSRAKFGRGTVHQLKATESLSLAWPTWDTHPSCCGCFKHL